MSRMPTLFIPHGGGPCFFMDWDPPHTWDRMATFLRGLQASLPEKPKAVLVISGHWEEAQVTVQTGAKPPLLFDYYGFPAHTYQLIFPAPGSPDLANRVTKLLGLAGFSVRGDAARGYDHGVFIPLKLVFPEADVPVVQLSLRADYDPAAHLAMGAALEPLRDEGVLILGSGMSYHNMGVLMKRMRGGTQDVESESQVFDDWLTGAVTDPDPAARNAALVDWTRAPAARDAHPREEHFLPLHVVAGAAGADIGVKVLGDVVMGAVESAFRFG